MPYELFILSFFRVGRAFFKVEYIINCVIFVPMKITTAMSPIEFYQIVAYPTDPHASTLFKSFSTYPEAVDAVPSFLPFCCKVYVYCWIIPADGSFSRKLMSSYEPE